MKSKDPAKSSITKIRSPFSAEKDLFSPLIAVVIGGGWACHDLLKNVRKGGLAKLNLDIRGVADNNEDAPGMVYARELGLLATTDFRELYSIPGLNLIIELTGSELVMDDLLRTRPPGISLIDHRAARMLWIPLLKEAAESGLEALTQYHSRKRQDTQTILDSLPYRLMVVNTDMSINMVNQTFLKYTNLKNSEVLKRRCYEVREGLDRPCSESGMSCHLEEVKKNGRTISTIQEYTGEDGDVHYDVVTVAPIFNEHDEVLQILETAGDVTKRIRFEREAQKSNIFFQHVIQSAVDGIVVVDTRGYVLVFNEGMERLTGYSAKEIMKHGHLTSFYNIEVAKENMRKMRSDQHGPVGKLNPTSMSITSEEGEEIPVTLTASLITINDKEIGSVGVFTDMREILKMRKELEDAHLQLVQSEKIGSVGRMAAGVAHEINNPLAGVLIFAELLKKDLKGNAQHLGDIQEIIDQTLRCKKIVAELLEFSRQSVGKVISFSLENLIDRCLNLLIKQAAFQDIKVVREIEPDMPFMLGDMGQLQQVFANLFINASDAMEGKGKLHVKAGYYPQNLKFVISVTDTGPGIPADMRDKVFDIFYTTKPVGKGTGLGLSISQNIINLHGGSLRLECPSGGGTTFHIELPLESVESSVEKPVFIELGE